MRIKPKHPIYREEIDPTRPHITRFYNANIVALANSSDNIHNRFVLEIISDKWLNREFKARIVSASKVIYIK